MFKSHAPSWMQPKVKRQETAATTAAKGAGSIGRLAAASKDKSSGDAVSRLQKYASGEAERNKKAEEEKKKKPSSTAPSKGFVGKMIDKYYHGKKD